MRDRLMDDIELVAAGKLVDRLREVKDDGEVRAIRAAADLMTEVLQEIVKGDSAVARSGRWRRLEPCDALTRAEPAFDTIVAAGPNSALPHATAGDDRICSDALVVVDMGCLLDGYCSDCTRTFTGSSRTRRGRVYELVREAQESASRACSEPRSVARSMVRGDDRRGGIRRALRARAGPRRRAGGARGAAATQSAEESERLSAGNVVTVEPGVYLPGQLGVRIEDLVVVRDDGPEVLTPFPKSLVTVAA